MNCLPACDDYKLAVTFVSNVIHLYAKDPSAWWKREREFDRQYDELIFIQKRLTLRKKTAISKLAGARRSGVNTNHSSMPDFAPPRDTLPGAFMVKGKGKILDLSKDPQLYMLQEAEINLASTLRLPCATYICCKRRIFQARVKALKLSRDFRKVDAQRACRIDVNKASKLWQAYETVGWFNADHFRQYV